MKRINFLLITMLLVFVVSCKKDAKNKNTTIEDNSEETLVENKINQEELKYVVNESFPVGDVRRYGIKVDGGNPTHPFTNKPTYETVCDISQELGIEIFFPKGFYKDGLIIRGKENVTINFDGAEFAGPIYIIEDKDKKESRNITFKGKVTSYTKFHTRYSSKITIDTLYIKTNDELSQNKLRSSGCDIFRGTENLKIKSLIIDDLGSGNKEFLTSTAALLIHGWGANPKDVIIDNVHIKTSDRHGAYVTGNDIIIENLTIDAFGLGESKSMATMQDAAKGEEQNITGLWVNNCNNSIFGNVKINTNKSKGKYAVWLDTGDAASPTIIEGVVLNGGDSRLPIYAEETTNVVIKSLDK